MFTVSLNQTAKAVSVLLAVLASFNQLTAQPDFCNEPTGTPGFPSDVNCQNAVCDIDPYCCNVAWDRLCASQALVLTECQPCSNAADCPEGFYISPAGCTPCELGRYCPGDGNSYPCPSGSYNSTTGNIECQPCLAGTYANFVGAVECVPCPAGSFQPFDGSSTCQFCPEGTFQSAIGAVACISCSPGYYSGAIGAVECLMCPYGTYSEGNGANQCQTCPPGTAPSGLGTCLPSAGCTYTESENYDPTAWYDDGSCTFFMEPACPADLNYDGLVNTSDLLIFMISFGTPCDFN